MAKLSMMLLIVLLTALEFSSCDWSMPPRPDTNLCVLNSQALHKYCYNMHDDYDDNGLLIPGHKPKITQYKDASEMLEAINKTVGTDPTGWANLKAYVKNLREINQ